MKVRFIDTTLTLLSVVLLAIGCGLFTGCQTATQPGRSQTQTFEDCVFNVTFPGPGPMTGTVTTTVSKVPTRFIVGDIFSQNMMVETGGNEANSSEATSVPSTSVPVNVAWGAGAIGGGGASGSSSSSPMSLDSAYLAFKKWWSEGGNKTSTTATTTAAKTATTVAPVAVPVAECPGGNCSVNP